jgi:hypothetical protein
MLDFWRNNFFRIALCILAFAIPFPFVFGAIAMWILVFSWLIQTGLSTRIRKITKPPYLIWILYFLLFAVSYFYSENKAESVKDLEKKLSLLILPVIVGTSIGIAKKDLEKIFFWFIAGIAIISVYCIGNAVYLYQSSHDKELFFYHTLVENLDSNAVYMSFYTIFALFLLLFYKWDYFFKLNKNNWRWPLISIIFVFLLLLSCRLIIVVFFALLLLWVISSLFRTGKFFTAKKMAFITIATFAGSLILFTNNPVKTRYQNLRSDNIRNVFEKDYKQKALKLDNLTIRLFIWRVCVQNIEEKNLWAIGCGNGDIEDIQNKKMLELGLPGFDDKTPWRSGLYNIAIHNMYLQTLMMIGIPGVFCLLCIVFLPFFYLKRMDNKFIFLVFHITAALFMCQESGLETQAGIIYYTFFSMVFWNYYYSQKNNKEVVSSCNGLARTVVS